jgi:hypothetical protein
MKHIQITLALIAAALLSTPASANDGADPVLTSFERDLHYVSSTHTPQPAQAEVDPLTEALSTALRSPRKPETRALSAAAPRSGQDVGHQGG